MIEYVKRLLLAILMTIILAALIIGGKQSIANAEEIYYDLNWELPTNGVISDIYGSRHGSHKGIDIAAKMGTPIHAVDYGVVSQSYFSNTYGNVVFIKHSTGFETVYAHLQTREVKKGQQVKKGEMIGRMGNTGKSSGPHLHFEIHKHQWTVTKENSIDPFVIFGYGKVGQHIFAGNKKIEHAIEVTKDVSHKPILYTVKDGDTLWDIAEKFNTKISVIIKSNNLSDEKIIPGQKLIISNRSS